MPPVRDHNHRSGLRSALYLPIFDALADPAVVARLAADQASLPAPRPPTRNSGHLPVRP
jgi:hypothetical protein